MYEESSVRPIHIKNYYLYIIEKSKKVKRKAFGKIEKGRK